LVVEIQFAELAGKGQVAANRIINFIGINKEDLQ
jgi:hypothetical protein